MQKVTKEFVFVQIVKALIRKKNFYQLERQRVGMGKVEFE
jgi:hypothetical protein